MSKKFKIYTYGCQMNVHESEKLAGILHAHGYSPTEEDEQADIIVFNTCCIRQNAEDRAKGNIGALKKLKKAKPELMIAVGGCMTQQKEEAEKLHETFPFVDIIFGTHNLEDFGALLEEKAKSRRSLIKITETANVTEGTKKLRTSYPNAWVNVMYGCNNFCSYCIVPYVRGRERSRKSDDILSECRDLIKSGYKEITLLGQNVNSYGKDLDDELDFADLIAKVAAIDGTFRLRFMTNHPKDFNEKLIGAIKENAKICKAIHLPIQSGSDRILALMNRHYTRSEYLEKIKRIREAIPDCALTTDVMVGFPTESEADFQDTLSLIREIRFNGAFTFVYSPRPGTKAAEMTGQVDEETAKDRIKRLIDVQNEINRRQSEEYFGKTVEILCEGYDEKRMMSYGRDGYGKTVFFTGGKNCTGKFIDIKIVGTNGISLIGEHDGGI